MRSPGARELATQGVDLGELAFDQGCGIPLELPEQSKIR
jgi:hypothetical protein